MSCYMHNYTFYFVFVFPKMEAPNLIFECILLGVNKVLVLVLEKVCMGDVKLRWTG